MNINRFRGGFNVALQRLVGRCRCDCHWHGCRDRWPWGRCRLRFGQCTYQRTDRKANAPAEARSDRRLRPDVGICADPQHPEHNGKPCACWDCNHVEGVCVSHESRSGCGACDGPVAPGECDLTLVNTDGDDLCNPNVPVTRGGTPSRPADGSEVIR
jgi:hypothetical protein